jgi:septal ring factor EnvC (AmiA/AmiB activator)
MTLTVWLVCACVAGMAGGLLAQDVSKLSDAERQQVNDWMAERMQRMVAVHGLDKELSQAWADERFTSPEIAALRTRYQALQQELAEVQMTLKKKVMELPEVKEKKQQLEGEQKKIRDLSEKVKEKAGADR